MNRNTVDKKSANFSKIIRNFKDKWVGVTDDYSRVLASADSLAAVSRKLGKDASKTIIFRVIPFDMVYSPSVV